MYLLKERSVARDKKCTQSDASEQIINFVFRRTNRYTENQIARKNEINAIGIHARTYC